MSTSESLNRGDIVTLNSGSPEMTVIVISSDRYVTAAFFSIIDNKFIEFKATEESFSKVK